MPVELQIADTLASEVASERVLEDAYLNQVLAAASRTLHDPRLQHPVCVRLCDKTESRQLNLSYRAKDKPTNVLSFPADLDIPESMTAQGELPLGDLAICWALVEEEARAQHKSTHAHFTHLFVHGLLHLLGFDHEVEAQAQQMENAEIVILEQFGITNPYEA